MTYFEETLVTNNIGRQFWIHSGDKFYVQRIGGGGPFQKSNLVRLRNLKPQARTIIDIGANIGMNTIEYATWGQTVHSFEPTPQTYEMLLKNIELAKRQGETKKGWHKQQDGSFASTKVTDQIFTYKMAVSSAPGEAEIVICPNNAGHNHLDNSHIPTANGKARASRVEKIKAQVELRTLDSFGFTDVDIIKIDVEGHEFEVLHGAEKTIMDNLPVLQLEMLPDMAKRFGHSCQDIYDWFAARDYVPTLNDGRVVGPEWAKFTKQIDRFFVHKSQLVE